MHDTPMELHSLLLISAARSTGRFGVVNATVEPIHVCMKGSAKMTVRVTAVMGHRGNCARSIHLAMECAIHSSARHRMSMMVETAALPHARKQIVELER
mmetsp:Transcript_3921/g.9028  ORF Transcript_3921/g.9028 Transcript_3921/m.9028 type:complete len:99 (+) Transcript_3921:1716-2012(+)